MPEAEDASTRGESVEDLHRHLATTLHNTVAQSEAEHRPRQRGAMLYRLIQTLALGVDVFLFVVPGVTYGFSTRLSSSQKIRT